MKCPYCSQDVPDDVWHKCDDARASLIKLSRQCGKSETIKDWMDAITEIPKLMKRIEELEKQVICWRPFNPDEIDDRLISGDKYLVITTEGTVEYAQYLYNWLGGHFIGIPSDILYYAELPSQPTRDIS
jgi:hypothetical protein